MRKTFCDRCGAECVNTTGHFNGYIEHSTGQGEQVGLDEIKPVDLCKGCTDIACEVLGLFLAPREAEKPYQTAEGWHSITPGPEYHIGRDIAG